MGYSSGLRLGVCQGGLLVAQQLEEQLGQQLVVVDRGHAAGGHRLDVVDGTGDNGRGLGPQAADSGGGKGHGRGLGGPEGLKSHHLGPGGGGGRLSVSVYDGAAVNVSGLEVSGLDDLEAG